MSGTRSKKVRWSTTISNSATSSKVLEQTCGPTMTSFNLYGNESAETSSLLHEHLSSEKASSNTGNLDGSCVPVSTPMLRRSVLFCTVMVSRLSSLENRKELMSKNSDQKSP